MTRFERELKTACANGRQPKCPHCAAPLEVEQVRYKTIRYEWSELAGRYEHYETDESWDKPRCADCQTQSWDFLEGMTHDDGPYKQLGLVY